MKTPRDTREVKLSRTVAALMARGIAEEAALSLENDGYSLSKLQALSSDDLRNLGLFTYQIETIHSERPPIPDDVLHRVLWNARRTCCMCRDPKWGIIIHHIRPWSESRSHAESNLVALCLNHHDLAHTRKELSRELTPEELMFAKKEWEEQVRHVDAAALYRDQCRISPGPVWDYFNRERLGTLAMDLDINVASIRDFLPSFSIIVPKDVRYRYENRPPLFRPDERAAYTTLVRDICERAQWVDLGSNWSRDSVAQLVTPSQIVVLQAAHRFRNDAGDARGSNQMRTGYYSARGIKLEFAFDAWEATSNSSYSLHLSGIAGAWNSTSICVVRSLEKTAKKLVVQASPLAIGTGFGNLRVSQIASPTVTADDANN